MLIDARIVYPHLFEPTAYDEKQEKKYEATFVIKKDDPQVAKIKEAIKDIITRKWPDGKPAAAYICFRDGDAEEAKEIYEGHWYFKAKSKTKPGVVDSDVAEIIDANKIRGGDYVRADVNFYPYDQSGVGVAAGLNNVQYVSAGERIGGGAKRPDQVFEPIAGGGESAAAQPTEGGGSDEDFFS